MPYLIASSFLVVIVLFTLAARYGTVYAGRILGARVYAIHHAVEHILEAESIPPEWIEPAPHDPSRQQRWEQRQKRRVLRKLRKLCSYLETTPSVSDVETREYVLGELRRIEQVWIRSDLAEIAEPRTTG